MILQLFKYKNLTNSLKIFHNKSVMKKILLILTLIFAFTSQTFALEIVKPSSKSSTVYTDSTQIYGTVKPESTVHINSQQVKVWKDFFVHPIPLKMGDNKITVVETQKNGAKKTKVINIKRMEEPKEEVQPFIAKEPHTIWTAKTIKNYAPVREKASAKSNRVIDLPKGIVLYLSGKQGDYYKIEETGETEFWINKNFISTPTSTDSRLPITISAPEKSYDNLYNYTKFAISYPVLYTIKQNDKTLNLTLYGVYGGPEAEKRNLEYTYNSKDTILGYDGVYSNGDFIFKTAKTPFIKNPDKPLEGLRIFIDAGHGGKDTGAIGPTKIPEKKFNLAIALKLIDLLQNEEGAIVSYSRNTDVFVDLNKRVDLAKQNDALISISIHNNSLPQGEDPYIKHGTGTYYYNYNAKNVAFIIKNNLVNDLKLKDDGLNYKSLVLDRATDPVSTLTEVAYLTYPQEYMLLQEEKFQMEAADSIRKSLKEFILSLKANK